MRSTKPGPEQLPDKAGDIYRPPANDAKLAENVAKLESDLATEREQRAEERFIWIATAAVLGDFIAYALIKDVLGFGLIFLLELIVLAIVARRLGVDWAVQLIGWLMFQVSRRVAPDPSKDEKEKPKKAPLRGE